MDINVLEDMVTCPYNGFGGHKEALEPVYCGVIPELQWTWCFMLQLKTKNKNKIKGSWSVSLCKYRIQMHNHFYATCLFVGTSGHFSTHVKMPWRVNKHNLESTVEVHKSWLQEERRNTVNKKCGKYEWTRRNICSLTAVESGSLARLIPFTVRSVEAKSQDVNTSSYI